MKKTPQTYGNEISSGFGNPKNLFSEKGININQGDYFPELLILQNQLNRSLMINKELLNAYLYYQASKEKNPSSDTSTNPSCNKNALALKNQKVPSKLKTLGNKQQKKKGQIRRKKEADDQYEPQDSQSNHGGQYRLSQTKNVPKNYGQAILSFIRKNQTFTSKVLEHLEINFENFSAYTSKFRGKINSIADLRSFWVDEDCPYSKAYRILSMEYLRKHSLSHIFNSRVQNFGKHVKYRYKIISGIENPLQFTQIKDY